MSVIYESCPPPHLTLSTVISRRTAYGLIWLGHYHQQVCVAKMIMLTTGIHYDKNTQTYKTDNGHELSEEEAERYFGRNAKEPFLHMDFRHRRSMTPKAFFKELDELVNLSTMGLAPQVYGFGINQSYPIHYAFIVMEKVDCSLKDIYLRRNLDAHEGAIIKDLIDHMHDQYGIIHGDLKPSNVGVYLNKSKKIIKACLFDCQKIRHRDQMTAEQFRRSAEREGENFKKHIIMNIEERVGEPKVPPGGTTVPP